MEYVGVRGGRVREIVCILHRIECVGWCVLRECVDEHGMYT